MPAPLVAIGLGLAARIAARDAAKIISAQRRMAVGA